MGRSRSVLSCWNHGGHREHGDLATAATRRSRRIPERSSGTGAVLQLGGVDAPGPARIVLVVVLVLELPPISVFIPSGAHQRMLLGRRGSSSSSCSSSNSPRSPFSSLVVRTSGCSTRSRPPLKTAAWAGADRPRRRPRPRTPLDLRFHPEWCAPADAPGPVRIVLVVVLVLELPPISVLHPQVVRASGCSTRSRPPLKTAAWAGADRPRRRPRPRTLPDLRFHPPWCAPARAQLVLFLVLGRCSSSPRPRSRAKPCVKMPLTPPVYWKRQARPSRSPGWVGFHRLSPGVPRSSNSEKVQKKAKPAPSISVHPVHPVHLDGAAGVGTCRLAGGLAATLGEAPVSKNLIRWHIPVPRP